MLSFFIIFCIIGFVIGFTTKDTKIAMSVIAIITLCWVFIYGPWALATFVELMMGYVVAKAVMKHMGGLKS